MVYTMPKWYVYMIKQAKLWLRKNKLKKLKTDEPNIIRNYTVVVCGFIFCIMVRLFEKPRFRFSFGFHKPEPRFRFSLIFSFVLFSALSVSDSVYNEWLLMF